MSNGQLILQFRQNEEQSELKIFFFVKINKNYPSHYEIAPNRIEKMKPSIISTEQ